MRPSPKSITKVLPHPKDPTGELLLLLTAIVIMATLAVGLVMLISPALHLMLA